MSAPKFSYELQEWAAKQTEGPGKTFTDLKAPYCRREDPITLALLEQTAIDCGRLMAKDPSIDKAVIAKLAISALQRMT